MTSAVPNKPYESGYIFQFTRKMDEKGRFLAKKFHLYSLYLAIDSGKLSCSMIKYYYDVFLANSDLATKAMQAWMKTPAGMATATSSGISLIAFSLMATHFSDKDKNLFKRYVAVIWPYTRDSLKALKNAYRAVNGTFTLMNLLEIEDLRHLIVPAGVLLSGLSILNRIWYRRVVEQRKMLLADNATLLSIVEAIDDANLEEINALRQYLKGQSQQLRIYALLSAASMGMIDGLNPYIGTFGLCVLTTNMLAVITVFCGLYLLGNLAMRVYEEINSQRQLIRAQIHVELALYQKEMAFLGKQLADGELELNGSVIQKIEHLSSLHQQLADKLKDENALSLPFLLKGLKNGLAVYKYVMLTISTIIFLSPIKLQTFQPIERAILGMTALTLASLHALIVDYRKQAGSLKLEKQIDGEKQQPASTNFSFNFYYNGLLLFQRIF
ncbi:hypothetical protein [Legionella tunisiensis]|uniref:hypothetical protein n=1 Tax=Legionella tunisiensis TaxID=1034944 RepID=UPI0012E996F5|nr:hypothetical protein [Legionella tunisiensis]